ncbi:MAG TPA: hypothetical protein VJW20_20310 [Candidatus Angelobacter sp.]|nr:hypothetical protein [Candidatus Angelobacter sp.]
MKFAFRSLSHCGMFLICCFLFVFLCGCAAKKTATSSPGQPAPPTTTLHKLSVSAFEIANAVDSGEKEFEALYSSNLPGVSDDDYAKTVATIFLTTETCTKGYITQLQSLTTVDDSNKAQVVGWTNTLVACVNALINNGVAGIKNPDAKAKIQSLLQPIPAAVSVITNLLGMATQTTSTGQCLTCAPLIFTEVNFGPTSRSKPDRAWNSIGREPDRVLRAAQKSLWSFRPGSADSGRPDQRCGSCPDAIFPEPYFRPSRKLSVST